MTYLISLTSLSSAQRIVPLSAFHFRTYSLCLVGLFALVVGIPFKLHLLIIIIIRQINSLPWQEMLFFFAGEQHVARRDMLIFSVSLTKQVRSFRPHTYRLIPRSFSDSNSTLKLTYVKSERVFNDTKWI
jgi:hypothetical protein